MELEFNRQIIALQNEISILKSALTPSFQFLQEIQEIKKKHHISQANNISNIAILALDIKEDILKDVASIQVAADDRLSDYKSEVKAKFDEHFNDTIKIKEDITNLISSSKESFSNFLSVKNTLGETSMYIKELKREMEHKASLNNIDELRQVMKSMTPISSHESLKNRVGECVLVYQFQDLQKKVEQIKIKQKEFVETEEIDVKFKEFTMLLSKEFQLSYITSHVFESLRSQLEKKFSEHEDRFVSTKDYMTKLDGSTNERLRVVKKFIEARPWGKELAQLGEDMTRKVSKVDLEEYTGETMQLVKNFAKDMFKFKVSVENFEKVVERFDEILLDKAEKDETQRLSGLISTMASLETVESMKKYIQTFTKDNESRFLAQCAMVDKVKANFDYILERFETLKKENFEVSNLSSSIADFKEAVERKADKQDIFEIYDNMCKRVDFLEATEGFKLLKKQVEQATALMFALCRTLVNNGDGPNQVKKERYELLKNLNNLMNWIAGDTWSGPQSARNEGPEEDSNDARFPSRQSAFMRRRSAATAKDSKRFHIDFPRLV